MLSTEVIVTAVVAVIIFYLILGSILAFTWNRSVAKVWGSDHTLGVIEAIFLLITMNILFGTFSHGAMVMYNNGTDKIKDNSKDYTKNL
jgi:hypothetical protein